ncbi:hypothetical protein Tco_0471692 [Tanacetum coccineum]
MLENDVEFGALDKRSSGFLNPALPSVFFLKSTHRLAYADGYDLIQKLYHTYSDVLLPIAFFDVADLLVAAIHGVWRRWSVGDIGALSWVGGVIDFDMGMLCGGIAFFILPWTDLVCDLSPFIVLVVLVEAYDTLKYALAAEGGWMVECKNFSLQQPPRTHTQESYPEFQADPSGSIPYLWSDPPFYVWVVCLVDPMMCDDVNLCAMI